MHRSQKNHPDSPRNTKQWITVLVALTLVAAMACGGSSGSTTSPGNGKLELNSGSFGPGHQYQHRFATAGTYHYRCLFHSPMTGTVNVSAAAIDTLVNVNITSSTSPFPGASVKTGGKVVWTNNTGMNHTVTSN